MRGINLYPPDEINRQIAFIAYYFKWSAREIVRLPHRERVRFCGEINRINKERSGQPKSIFEI